MSYACTLSQESGSRQGTLTLSGALTLKHCNALRQELLAQASQQDGLRLVIKEVTELDAAFVQLLLALAKHQDEQKKPFYLQVHLNPPLDQLLHHSGLNKKINENSL